MALPNETKPLLVLLVTPVLFPVLTCQVTVSLFFSSKLTCLYLSSHKPHPSSGKSEQNKHYYRCSIFERTSLGILMESLRQGVVLGLTLGESMGLIIQY